VTNRRSLHIGINYEGTANELYGCVNDALDWARAARARGYDTRTLLDVDATRVNVLAILREAVDATRYRDRLFITYSGHGTKVPDADGDEADGFDEALVCADMRLVTDDELHAVFSARHRGARVVFVADSCFSGTVQRAFGDPTIGRPRYLPPAQLLDAVAVTRAVRLEEAARPTKPSRVTALLLSAARETEVAYDAEIGGRARGAFTAAALDALAEQPADYRAWHASIELPSQDFPQTPQLGATWAQRRWKVLD